MKIDADFESGSIGTVNLKGNNKAVLTLRNDTNSEFKQWFYFRVNSEGAEKIVLEILDLDKTSYGGWENFHPFMSFDRENWVRIPGEYADGTLTISLNKPPGIFYISYYAPYTLTQLNKYLYEISSHPDFGREIIGESAEKRPIELITIHDTESNIEKPYGIWIVTRQHPGEVMASWCLEGFLDFLLGKEYQAGVLRRNCIFKIVPLACPDGVVLGNQRSNAVGANLNRQWDDPDPVKAPEVDSILNEMHQWVDNGNRFDLYLDLHGDEEARGNFVYGIAEKITDKKYQIRQAEFIRLMAEYNPDFSVDMSFLSDSNNREIAKQSIYLNFGALSFTFEMTYRDLTYGPNKNKFMLPAQNKELGRTMGEVIAHMYG